LEGASGSGDPNAVTKRRVSVLATVNGVVGRVLLNQRVKASSVGRRCFRPE